MKNSRLSNWERLIFGRGASGEIAKIVCDIKTQMLDKTPIENSSLDSLFSDLGRIMFRNPKVSIADATRKKSSKGKLEPVDKAGIKVSMIYMNLRSRLKHKPPTVRQWIRELGAHEIVGKDTDCGEPSERYARKLAKRLGLQLAPSRP